MANGEQLGYITKKTNANVNLIFLFFLKAVYYVSACLAEVKTNLLVSST